MNYTEFTENAINKPLPAQCTHTFRHCCCNFIHTIKSIANKGNITRQNDNYIAMDMVYTILMAKYIGCHTEKRHLNATTAQFTQSKERARATTCVKILSDVTTHTHSQDGDLCECDMMLAAFPEKRARVILNRTSGVRNAVIARVNGRVKTSNSMQEFLLSPLLGA